MKIRSQAFFLGVLAFVAVWAFSLQFEPASAQETQALEQRIQALEQKLDRVLENQEKILMQLERIWKFK